MPCNVRSALCVLRMTYLVLGEVGALGQRLRLVEGPVTLVGRVLRQHDVSLRSELVCHVTVLLSRKHKSFALSDQMHYHKRTAYARLL